MNFLVNFSLSTFKTRLIHSKLLNISGKLILIYSILHFLNSIKRKIKENLPHLICLEYWISPNNLAVLLIWLMAMIINSLLLSESWLEKENFFTLITGSRKEFLQ